jgi:ketosteroid isomerase-like protein
MSGTGREAANVEVVLRYIRAVEAGATGAALAAFFTADVVYDELPNRLLERGLRRDLAGLLAAAERGRAAVGDQRFDVKGVVAQGDKVAVELVWSGTLKVPLGASPPGTVLRAHIGMFVDLSDGKIAAQRNYDCYEPW